MNRIGPILERLGRTENRGAENRRLIDELAARLAVLETQVAAHAADTVRHTGKN